MGKFYGDISAKTYQNFEEAYEDVLNNAASIKREQNND